jgi:type VI secretion system protein ImpK
MSWDDSFRDPKGNDRTVWHRPIPGGRRPEVPPHNPFEAADGLPSPFDERTTGVGPQAPRPALAGEAAPVVEPTGPLATGQSPLLTAAAPLLQLLSRLRNTFNPPDPGTLREHAIRAVRDFETAGRAAGIPIEMIRPAGYALCASIDDVVLATPWGHGSEFEKHSLVSTFHYDVTSGEGFFKYLAVLKQEPSRNFMLLELMYLCLSLGYQGQYRLFRQGPAQLEGIREDLYQTIVRLRPAYEQALSLRWHGVEAPYRPARAVVPVWVMAAVAVAIVGMAWLYLWNGRVTHADAAVEAAHKVAPTQMPLRNLLPAEAGQPAVPKPPPPVEDPGDSKFADAVRGSLQNEIRAGAVDIVPNTPQSIQLRIFNNGMFDEGKATVRPAFASILERIGEALNQEPGDVVVTGHTDNVRIRTLLFPSNDALSLARARAAAEIILHTLHDPARLTTEGHADREPVQDNATAEHRAENRRVEVILQRRSR